MNPDRQQALDYLHAPVGGLWHWAENGNVLVWRDGTTIAFREEIARVLETLAPNGLPSFGAIVFLLAACRGKTPAVSDIVPESNAALPPQLGSKASLLLTARAQLKAQLEAALVELRKCAQLPAEIKANLPAKCVLAEAAFEPAKVERCIEAAAVLRGVREPMTDTELTDPERAGRSGSYLRQIHMVAEGLKPHTAESLLLRLRTSLDSLPAPAELELPAAERARKLIEELSRDRKFGFVARAARELMAAVRLPRRLQEQEQLAVGGVADLSNRGPLDRLLLSELAHDDLTLAVRVALNEALYLRREPPLREPPGTLALLLVSGLRSWGVPRVLAAAVALAFVACDKQHSKVLSWRASGDRLEPVELLSREGLLQHLAALATTAHPGESLRAFAEAVDPLPEAQSVIITDPDTLADPEFRRALADHPHTPGFVATVERSGRFELHALPLSRRQPVCEADLDLDALFETKPGLSVIKREADPDLPAIFRIDPFPFLLPLPGKLESWIGAEGRTYGMLTDRRLVQFGDRRRGGRVLADQLPHGRTIWMDCGDDRLHLVKAGSNAHPARLVSLNLPHDNLRVSELVSGAEVLAVHRYGDVIVLIRHYDVRAYSLADGKLVGQVRNPYHWCQGRFLRGPAHMHFAVWDGQQVKLEAIPLSRGYTPAAIAVVFDREGMDGPWFVYHTGLVVCSATEEQVQLPMPFPGSVLTANIRVSRDGHRLYYSAASRWHRIQDLNDGTVLELPEDFRGEPVVELVPRLPYWNLRRVVHSITAGASPVICWGRTETFSRFQVDKKRGRAQLTTYPATPPGPGVLTATFAEQRVKTTFGCTLRVTELAGCAKVYLDSRGLMHLKSKDPNVPEVSLVLAEPELAGWTSDGHVCGPPFFFEGDYVSEPALVYERLLRCLHPV